MSRRRRPTRSVLAPLGSVLLALALALGAGTLVVPGASGAPAAGSKGLVLSKKASDKSYRFTNKKRARHHVRTLKRSSHLDRLAKRQARRMATQQRLHHNPRLSRQMKRWCTFGENVAYDRSVKRADKRLWRSPGHRANMLDRRFDQLGTGVAIDRDGTRWVAQVFRKKC